MSFIYFIRHAQAGTRENYDVLSDIGRTQAEMLGEHFADHGIEFSAVYAGGMNRQRLTAEIACAAMAKAGPVAPDVIVDERWNEFSLLSVYRAICHRLMEESPEFASDYREMQKLLTRDPHTTGGATGRCDAAIIRAWMENRYPDFTGETWDSFRSRIASCAAALPDLEREKSIAVFTSATPVAIVAAAALGLTDDRLLNILGVIYNTSVTVMRAKRGEMRLFSFNATPHLKPSLRTFR